MNPNGRFPNLAGDLVRIHKVISRGLNVGGYKGMEFIDKGFPDQGIQQGYMDYVKSLVSVISAHHMGEDEIAFPVLKKRIPDAPFDRLSRDHMNIEETLSPVRKTLSENKGNALDVVVKGLMSVSSVWSPHIEIEEKSFSEHALTMAMIPDEQAEVSALLTKHAQDHTGPPFHVLPFVLFNLTGADRADMAALFPKVVTEELIPNEWKEKWALMKPFLLE
jgi:hypothetical protein